MKYATVKDMYGTKYELGEARLTQLDYSRDCMDVRWIGRAGVLKGAALLHNKWWDGSLDNYMVDIAVTRGRMNIGCRTFGRAATKKILDWAKAKTRKPAKRAKRGTK